MNKDSINLPAIPLRGITIFPNMIIHFDVGREKSISALEESMLKDSKIFLVSQIDPEIEDPKRNEIYSIGTICKIKQILKLPKGVTRVLVEGVERAAIIDLIDDKKFMEVVVEKIDDELNLKDENEDSALRNLLSKAFKEYIKVTEGDESKVIEVITKEEELGKVTDLIAAYIQLDEDKKQTILETINVSERIEKLLVFIKEEIEIVKIENSIGKKVKNKLDKSNKEYFLREQLKVIQEELGEDDEKNEIDNYAEKINKAKMPKEVREKAERELSRLKTSYSSDGNNIRNYLDWLIELPWNKSSNDSFDIEKAEKILDDEHYGLEEVKERILEYLAVKQYTKSLNGPILCLVGPPGVGKSSIAKSVANSLNRKFARISLGGLRDEAEIRGHRRTYVGAIPGRIINGIKEAQTKNPVFLLDEIDKMAADYKGDPASAMLEVLDPEQNKTFVDHYLEVPFDLSKILFITTANSLSTIPGPLLDRMEIIEVSGYIEEEKLNIAQKYLLPKQIKENGLVDGFVTIEEQAMRDIINYYTREAGVRTLERTIGKVCRKIARKFVEDPSIEGVVVTQADVEEYLGRDKYLYDLAGTKPEVGVVTGLAWTSVGGVTLPVEVNVLKGKGQVVLTGSLGDVMKESAQAGISYIRSIADKFDIDQDFYKTEDIHIHCPEGATPKDGPSAGVTMATAVISALTKIPVRSDVAMTGEITLRGRVMVVGGVKEKVLAAHRAGIKKVLIPRECDAQLDDIPENVKEKLEIVLVDHMDQVLEHALVKDGEKNEN